MPIVFLMANAIDERDDERIGHHRTGGDRLPPQLVEAAAVEQAVELLGMPSLARKPISRVPMTPPTRWTPTTSSESS